MELKYKYLAVENVDLKALGDGPGEISGYANVKNVIDRGGDMVVDGAYQDLETLVKGGWGAVGHDWCESVATIEEAKEDARGLWVRMQFHSDPESQAARLRCKERIERGKNVFFSIGYEVLESGTEKRDGETVYLLNAIRVREVSIVLAPMNEVSMADGIKSISEGGPLAGTRLETHLAKALAAVGEAVAHFDGYAAKRAEEGRVISPDRLEQAENLCADLNALIAKAYEPDKQAEAKDATDAERVSELDARTRAERARYIQ